MSKKFIPALVTTLRRVFKLARERDLRQATPLRIVPRELLPFLTEFEFCTTMDRLHMHNPDELAFLWKAYRNLSPTGCFPPAHTYKVIIGAYGGCNDIDNA
ncbi:hypothetical protein M422DRAFT_29776 [Sphaerobolus stellatus SS14]|uniref:Uncharacterized protein n=1 Tax=Sphaerobolus stellatus (strain SS14) TaxID=990650 RepID=A0A0C9W265_SPHS4|nr:hypothetical protein M422DRAFT_29776 [Sphaerobolus stellatus SS14]